MALISRRIKLSLNPIEDQRNAVGIKDMAVIANLNKRSSRPFAFAKLIINNVAKVE